MLRGSYIDHTLPRALAPWAVTYHALGQPSVTARATLTGILLKVNSKLLVRLLFIRWYYLAELKLRKV